MIEKLNLDSVRIAFSDFNICIDKPFPQQLEVLKEDLLQLEIEGDYIIDVGYYPEFSLNGEFKVFIIKDYDWSVPFWVKSCKTTELLVEYIQEAIDKITKK